MSLLKDLLSVLWLAFLIRFRRCRILPHKQGVIQILEPTDPTLDGSNRVQQTNVPPNKEINRLIIMTIDVPNGLPSALAIVVLHEYVLALCQVVPFLLCCQVVTVTVSDLAIWQHLAQRRDPRADQQGAAVGGGPAMGAARDHQPGGGVDRVVEAGDAHAGQHDEGAVRQDGRVDKVRAEQVDADALAVAQGPQAAEQARHAVLGGDILGHAGQETQPGAGAHEQQVFVLGTTTASRPFWGEPKQGQVRRVHGPDQVHLKTTQARRRRVRLVEPDGVLKALARDGPLLVAHAGRDDDGVEAARGRQPDGFLEEADLGGPICDVDVDEMMAPVGRMRRSGTAAATELGDQRSAVVVVDVPDDQVGAVRCPPARKARAQAGRAARDEDGLAREGGRVDGGRGVHGRRLVDRGDDAVLVGRGEGGHFW